MLLQTNSYIVPRDKRVEHARLLRRFRQTLLRLGCDHFEVYEQTGPNWTSGDSSGRFVQIMRFRDRKQQLAVQNAERADPGAQALLKEFCELINLPYQQQQGLFAAGFYTSFMRMPEARPQLAEDHPRQEQTDQTESPTDGESLMAVAEPATEDGNSNPEPTNGAEAAESHEIESSGEPEAMHEQDATGEPEAGADAHAAFHADDESDYSESLPMPEAPADQAESAENRDEQAQNLQDDSRNQDEQAENPTFPSSS
jgi:hypothetical protein